MKRLILIGLLTLLAAGCDGRSPDAESQTPDPEAPSETTPAPTADSSISEPAEEESEATTNQVYTNDSYGFEFTYPDRYYIDSPVPIQPTNPDVQEIIQIWQQADYEDIQGRLGEATELPPNITIQVIDNSAQKPLTDWKEDLSSDDDRPLTLDGQAAIAYSSTGLYEQDNVLVPTPSGQYVLHFSVGYFDAESPMRDDFQTIVQSLSFK